MKRKSEKVGVVSVSVGHDVVGLVDPVTAEAITALCCLSNKRKERICRFIKGSRRAEDILRERKKTRICGGVELLAASFILVETFHIFPWFRHGL